MNRSDAQRTERQVATNAQAQHGASARQLVDGHHRNRGHRRMAHVRIGDAQAEPDRAGAGCRGRQHRQRIARRTFVAEPDLVEPERFGLLDELDHPRTGRRGEQPHTGSQTHSVRRLHGYGLDSDHPVE